MTSTESKEDASESARARILLVASGQLSLGALGEALRMRFEVREAVDDEAAWQAILLDPAIRVVAGDVHSANAHSFDLFERIRSSKVQRIRELSLIALLTEQARVDAQRLATLDASPVVIGDGRSISAIDQLTERLGVMLEISETRKNIAESSGDADPSRTIDPETELLHPDAFDRQVEKLLAFARRSYSDVALIGVLVELRLAKAATWEGEVEQRIKLVGRALAAAIRLEDLASRTGPTEFCVATQSRGTTDMLRFAARLRKVLENVDAAGPGVEVWTSIGVATLSEELKRSGTSLRKLAQKRAAFAQSANSRRILLGSGDAKGAHASGGEPASMDINLALALIGAGRTNEVIPHLPRLIEQIHPLLHLIKEQQQSLGVGSAAPGTKRGRG